MVKFINLYGDHYSMGWQHGRQVRDLHSRIQVAMDHRLSQLEKLEAGIQPYVDEFEAGLQGTALSMLAMMRGIADGLSFDWEKYIRYTLACYLTNRVGLSVTVDQGCTVWAAAGEVTRESMPILAKNRDYWMDHRELQCLARAHPEKGYLYLYLTSAGSPGVFSSGINDAGLVIADTHVVSRDIREGLPRFAVMMEVLEHHGSVKSALDYLKHSQHIGDGTLALVDEGGDMAVLELTHTEAVLKNPKEDFLVSTNHFVSPNISGQWVESEVEALHGSSKQRYQRISAALAESRGDVNLEWAKNFLGNHGSPVDSICRHPGIDPRSVTISSSIFLPREKLLYLANGLPCQTRFEPWSVI